MLGGHASVPACGGDRTLSWRISRACLSSTPPVPQLWRAARPALSVAGLHAHVMGLHRALLAGLDAAGHPALNSGALVPPQVCAGAAAA